jgi:hypothetical protein
VAAFRDVPGTTGTLLAVDPDADGAVRALALSNGKLYLGGGFTTLAGGAIPRRHLASVNAADGSITDWNPDADGVVFALAPFGGNVVAGGEFSAVNGSTPRKGIAMLDASSGTATAWDAQLDGQVYAVASDGEQIFAGGVFTAAAGMSRAALAAFDPVSGAVASWNPRLVASPSEETVRALAATPHGWLAVGGRFLLDIGSSPAAQIAAFPLAPVASDPDEPDGPDGAEHPDGPKPDPSVGGDRTAPRLSKLKASRPRFRAGRLPRGGTRLSFTLSERASVSFEVFAVRRGRRLARRGRFVRNSVAGASRVRFTGRLRGRLLAPGRYVLRARPTDAAGNVGRSRSVKVRIVRKKPGRVAHGRARSVVGGS